MTYFVTSDTHFGHRFVAELRGFGSTEEHDLYLQDRWNAVVGPDDTVYHLGDVSLSLRDLPSMKRCHLNGHLVLVAGNHDECWHRRSHLRDARRAVSSVEQYLDAGFETVYTSGSILVNPDGRGSVLFSHLPVEGDHKAKDRYQDRRPGHGDIPVLCGHVHSEWRTRPGWAQLNVGMDVNNFTPIPLSAALREVRSMRGTGASGAAVDGPWNGLGLA